MCNWLPEVELIPTLLDASTPSITFSNSFQLEKKQMRFEIDKIFIDNLLMHLVIEKKMAMMLLLWLSLLCFNHNQKNVVTFEIEAFIHPDLIVRKKRSSDL